LSYRPLRQPHYGGHIERLIGTTMGRFIYCREQPSRTSGIKVLTTRQNRPR
jgi:hypothetical protein